MACGGVAWFAVHYVVQARDQSTAGTVAQGLAAVLVPVVGLGVWLVRHVRQSAPAIDLRQAVDDLAGRVGRQWHEAALQRGLFDRPLAVHWTWSPRGLSGPVDDAVGDRRAQRIAPLPGLSRVTSQQLVRGDLSDIFAVYGGLDSGRLVVVGAPGAGKSGAMIRLLLDAITHRGSIQDVHVRATVPVPVLLTAYDWLPENEGLAAWVTRRLQDEHPFLKTKIGSVSAARALVDAGAVSLLIDGVDEMPQEARTAVLRQIGQQTGHRIVLSSRTEELAGAVAGGHLDGAAALELAPVTARQAARYLQSRTVHPAPAAWHTLIRHLRDHDTSAAAQALDSPLMLSLLLDTYLPFDPVDELTDLRRFPDRRQIEDHLLGRVLPTAYTPRPGHLAPPCTPQQAQQWLSYLATQMNHTGTRDLAWWRIPTWLPSLQLRLSLGLVLGLVDGLAGGLAIGLAIGLEFGIGTGLMAGLVFGITVGLVAGLLVSLTAGRAIGLAVALSVGLEFGLMVGLAAGLEFGLELGRAVGLAVGLGAGLTVAVTVGLTVGLTRGLTSGLDRAAYDGFPPQYHRLERRSRLTIGHTAVGVVVGLAFGLVLGLAGQLVFGLTAGLATWLTGGATAGLASGLMSGLTQALNTSLPADELVTPIDSWQGNRRLVLALGLVAGMTAAITAGLTFGLATGAVAGMTAGITAGLAFGLSTGTAAWLTGAATNINFVLPAHTTFVLLHRAGHGPARMMDFLEDARRRGVLRTAGPVYQFRHAQLQDLLVGSGTGNGAAATAPVPDPT